LLDLICLRFAAKRLKIEDLGHALATKYMVIASNPLGEAELLQQGAQVAKSDICVRIAA